MRRRRGPGRTAALVGYTLVALALGAVLGWLAVHQVSLGQLLDVLAGASFPLVLLGEVFTVGAGVLRGVRWWLLLCPWRPSPVRMVLVDHVAEALNTIGPLRFLGEPVQFGILTLRDHLPGGPVLGSQVVQRVLDLALPVLLVGVGLVLLPPLGPLARPLATALVVAVIVGVGFFALGPRVRALPLVGRMRPVRELGGYVGALRHRPAALAATVLLTVAYQVALGLAGWAMALAVGLPIDALAAVLLGITAVFISGNVPGLFGALGAFECAVVYLLGLLAVEPERALGFALLLHTVFLLPPVVIAVAFLLGEGVRSAEALRPLLRRWREHRAAPFEGDER